MSIPNAVNIFYIVKWTVLNEFNIVNSTLRCQDDGMESMHSTVPNVVNIFWRAQRFKYILQYHMVSIYSTIPKWRQFSLKNIKISIYSTVLHDVNIFYSTQWRQYILKNLRFQYMYIQQYHMMSIQWRQYILKSPMIPIYPTVPYDINVFYSTRWRQNILKSPKISIHSTVRHDINVFYSTQWHQNILWRIERLQYIL